MTWSNISKYIRPMIASEQMISVVEETSQERVGKEGLGLLSMARGRRRKRGKGCLRESLDDPNG